MGGVNQSMRVGCSSVQERPLRRSATLRAGAGPGTSSGRWRDASGSRLRPAARPELHQELHDRQFGAQARIARRNSGRRVHVH